MRRSQPAKASAHPVATIRAMRHGLRRRTALRALAGGAFAGALAISPAMGPAAPARAALTVTVTTLSLPIGSNFAGRGVAINDSGQIAGWSAEKTWIGDTYVMGRNAEYWGPGGTQIDLNPPLAVASDATLINRNGVIAGAAAKDATAWIDRRPTNLADFACIGLTHCVTTSEAINDKDQIAVARRVGNSQQDEEISVWQNGTRSPWAHIGLGQVHAMDSAGLMVGEHLVGSANLGYRTRAFTLSGGTLTDLASPGWPAARAVAVNDSGQILGEVADPYFDAPKQKIHAVIWQNGTMIDLGTLGGGNSTVEGAHSLNDQGQVVGASDAADGTRHAFVWQSGQMTDLNVGSFDPAGAANGASAWAINSRGQVIGKADRGFFWQNGAVTWLPATVVAYAINNNSEMTGEVYSPVLNNHFGGTAPARIIVS